MRKVYCLILIVLVLLVMGCARQGEGETAVTTPTSQPSATNSPQPPATPTVTQTAVPSPTATLPPTATPQPTFIPTPESPGWILQPTPTIFPVTTPAESSDGYQLQDWDEAKAMEFIQLAGSYAENVQPVIDTWANQNEVYAYAQSIVEMAIYEALLRFPETPSREWLEWQLAYAQVMQGKPEATALVVELLEAGFADGRYTLDNLNDSLRPHRFAIQTGDYKPYPLEVTNLFGGGEINDLRLITTLRYPNSPQSDGALIAISRENPAHVTPIASNWSQGFGRFSQIWLHDLTNDNQPELLIDWDISSGGVACHLLSILHWQGEEFKNPGSALPCRSGWSIGSTDEKGNFIVEAEDTLIGMGAAAVLETYAWNGTTFELKTSSSPLPDNPDTYSANYYKDFYDPLSELHLLEEVEANWTDEWRKVVGPNYLDALRFRQATLNFSLGEPETAINMLRQVATKPTDPITPTISLAAQAFLDSYSTPLDLYMACTNSLLVLKNALNGYEPDGSIRDSEVRLKSWGLGQYNLTLCDPETAFEQIVDAWNESDAWKQTAVPDLFQQSSIKPSFLMPLDLDQDGDTDWLASIEVVQPETRWFTLHKLIALISTDEGLIPLPIDETGNNPPTPLPLDTVLLSDYDTPVHVLFFSYRPRIVAIETKNGEPFLREWLSYAYWPDFLDYQILNDSTNTKFIVRLEPRIWLEAYNEIVYQWDPDKQDFELLEKRADNSLGIPLDEAIAQAEALLLQKGDFAAAIPVLTAVLAELRAQDELTWAIPRPFYLLGLAYELSGDEANAVDAYWTLWQTFPESPYALLAQAKLQLTP